MIQRSPSSAPASLVLQGDAPSPVQDGVLLLRTQPETLGCLVDAMLADSSGAFAYGFPADMLTRAAMSEAFSEADPDRFTWVISDRSASEVLGVIELEDIGCAAEICFWVDPQHRRARVATRAIQAALRHASGLGFHCVYARAAFSNRASVRVLLETGFEIVDKFKATAADGQQLVSMLYLKHKLEFHPV